MILSLSTSPSTSHDWYPAECCNQNDCFQIDPERDLIEARRDGVAGYIVVASGEWFALERLRDTPASGRDHWARCTNDGKATSETNNFGMPKVCIYKPPARM